MNIKDVYSSDNKWLKAADLGGRKHRLTIDSMETVEFKQNGSTTRKVGINFVGKQKGLMLNKTNASLISKQYGDESDNWIGQTITIYPTTTEYQGDQVDCIRVELPVPEAAGEDEVPF